MDTSVISVVMPTYGRDQVLLETVEALLSLPKPPAEIVLADQTVRHDEAPGRVLSDWDDSGQVRWLRLLEPSIPRAMNQGLLAAIGPIVLFLDDDLRPDLGLVEAHAQAHASRPGQLVAGRVLQPWHRGRADPPDRELEALIAGQNTALQEVVMQTAALLRAQAPGVEPKSTAVGSPQAIPAPAHGCAIPWGWLSAGMLMGAVAAVALAEAAWVQLVAQ